MLTSDTSGEPNVRCDTDASTAPEFQNAGQQTLSPKETWRNFSHRKERKETHKDTEFTVLSSFVCDSPTLLEQCLSTCINHNISLPEITVYYPENNWRPTIALFSNLKTGKKIALLNGSLPTPPSRHTNKRPPH